MRYKEGLIGKHLKNLVQIMAFLVYDLVPQSVLDAWVIIWWLVILLWHMSIEDIESYLICSFPFHINHMVLTLTCY